MPLLSHTARADTNQVLYSYSNGRAVFDIETFFDRTANEFVLIFRRGDGHHVERFKDEIAFRTRIESLDQELEADKWQRIGTQIIPPRDWTN